MTIQLSYMTRRRNAEASSRRPTQRVAIRSRSGLTATPTGGESSIGSARESAELAPGIVEIPANFDVVEVKQDDRVVIIEAPLTSAYRKRRHRQVSERPARLARVFAITQTRS